MKDTQPRETQLRRFYLSCTAVDFAEERQLMFSRRDVLAVSAAGAVMTATAARAASFGNPDLPPQGAINAKGPGNLADPGPQSEALGKQFPSAQFPQAAEWAIMTYGSCRVTVLDAAGQPYVADVNEGDLWYFPAGAPHSLQGIGS